MDVQVGCLSGFSRLSVNHLAILLGGMTAVVAPVVARCHHAMWDEEPGRQGASAIVSEGASEESSASSGWAQQEVALDAHGDP